MKSLTDRNELILMITRIMSADGTEEEIDDLICQLRDGSPLKNVTDLIFRPEKEMSAEEIADAILSYKPLSLR